MGQRPEVLLPLRQDDIRSGSLDEEWPVCVCVPRDSGEGCLPDKGWLSWEVPFHPAAGGSDGPQLT